MNYNSIIVYDFETGGKDPNKCEILSAAALYIDPRRLTLGSYFYSLFKPLKPEEIDKDALQVNKLSLEELDKAPHPKQCWQDFGDFINKFNYKKNSFFAPVSAGFNICSYDAILVQRYCELYGPVNDKTGKQALFSDYMQIDLLDIFWQWFENVPKEVLPNLKFDSIRDYLGIDKTNAHNALVDVQHEAMVLVKFLRLYRSQFPKIQFKDALKGVKLKYEIPI